MMTEALGVQGGESVLEVGAGTGYQAAVLAELGARVVTVERHSKLAASAASRLSELGYANVAVHTARPDVLGCPKSGPYEAIIVTAAAPSVPKELLQQLQPGGRLVLPVDDGHEQVIQLVTIHESRSGHPSCDRANPFRAPNSWGRARHGDNRAVTASAASRERAHR